MAEKSVVRAFRLLEILSESDVPLGVSELSRQLAWTKSGTFRLLTTLTQLGYLRQLQPSMNYQLSHKVVQLASKSVRRLDLRQTSLPYLKRLLELTGETARLSVLTGDHAVCIEQIESNHPVTVQTQVGGVLPLGCSATGKAILAFQDEGAIRKVARGLAGFTPHTLVPPERLYKDLELTRRRGFSINQGERHLSVSGVAAPVRDRNGKVEAAIGISGPSDRLPLSVLLRHGEVIKSLADDLSEEMGWSSDRVEVMSSPEAAAPRPKRAKARSKAPA